MSVPSVPSGWLPDSVAVVHQNSSASTFSSPDPSAGMHSFDPSASVLPQVIGGLDHNHGHFQQQPRNQLQNGHSGHPSPGFQPPPSYNVNSVVPLKRPRPRDDSISISPRPAPQGLPPSRSQTPLSQNQQLAYQIYQNSQPQQQQQRQFPPVGYTNSSHLHNVGSANASPSPVMQNQTFNSQTNSAPKRVATQSPSPFSPAGSQQGFMPQVSPPPTNHPPRIDTPQNGNIGYSLPYTQGFQSPAPTASASPVSVGPAMSQSQMPAHMVYAQIQARQQQQQQQQQQTQQQTQQQAQQQAQARFMQQQHQAQQAQLQMHGMSGQAGPMNSMQMHPQPNSNVMGPNPGQMQRQPQSVIASGQRHTDPNQFMKNLQEFMQKRGTPLQGTPLIGSKPVSLVNLYANVIRLGGSQRVQMENKWLSVSASLGFPPEHPVAEEVSEIFKNYLAPFEEAWVRNQKEARQKQMMQQTRQNQQNQPPHPTQPRASSNGPTSQQPHRPQQGHSRPSGILPNVQHRPPIQNGYGPTSHLARQTPHHQPPTTPNRMSMDVTSPQGHLPPPGFPIGKPAAPTSESAYPLGTPVTPIQDTSFNPRVRVLDTHGGLDVRVMNGLGWDVLHYRPTVPTYHELGLIDIHALTMMLKSGITAEIRVALDALATVSVEARQSIALESCEDLLEALVDVAEAQVELLGEHAPEGAEIMSLMAYEDVLRACRTEGDTLLDVSRFCSLEHELERATDKLICATTILRNLSFFESNHNALAGPNVVRFVSGVIERLGTCPLFLRSYTNLLDFMKDIIIYLSNLSHAIVLPSEDEALNLLHLILAFAPQPLPHISGRDVVMFTSYSPSVHRYLPPAVDTLAKLLARDDPNRAFYRTIFLSESNTNLPHDLLTRSFALAISPIPDNNRTMLQQAVEARRPILEQGLLAAEILAQICPGNEHGLARSWLSSEDGFALSLLRLVCLLSPQASPMQQRPPRGMDRDDMMPFVRITHRGMNVLRFLAQKAGEMTDEGSRLPLGVLPKKESLLGALLTVHIDGTIVKELCSYAGLDD